MKCVQVNMKPKEPLENYNEIVLLSLVLRILKFVSLWKEEGPLTPRIIMKGLFFYILSNVIGCTSVGYMYYYYEKLGHKFDYKYTADVMNALAAMSVLYIMVACYLRAQPHYRRLLLDLTSFAKLHKPPNFIKVNDKLNLFARIFLMWMIFTISLVCGLRITMNCDGDTPDDCGQIIKAWMPLLDVYATPYRQIFATLCGVSAFVICLAGFYSSWLIVCVAEFLVNLFDHLKIQLEELSHITSSSERKAHVQKCIIYHQHILKFGNQLYTHSYKFLFYYSPLVSLVLTLIVYDFLMHLKYIMFAHLMLWFVHLVGTCFFGERLKSRSLQVSIDVQNNIGYDEDLSIQKDLLFMIMRSSKPLVLPAGFLGNCSHEMLMKVLKTTYTFMTLMLDQAE